MQFLLLLGHLLGSLIAYRIFLGVVMAIAMGRFPRRVLQKFQIQTSNKNQPLVRVVGRAEGLISFILTHLGLSDQTHFELHHDRIFYRSNSLSLQVVNTVMMDQVTFTICTIYQPIWVLVLGMLQLLGSVLMLLGVMWIGSWISVILAFLAMFSAYFFWTNRFLVMGVQPSSGGVTFGIMFKRSIIENMEVDFGKVRKAMQIVDDKLIAAK